MNKKLWGTRIMTLKLEGQLWKTEIYNQPQYTYLCQDVQRLG